MKNTLPVNVLARLTVLLWVGLAASNARSQDFEILSHEGLQKLIRQTREQHELPGMVVGVLRDGELVAVAADGLRKFDTDIAMKPSDKIHLGSCTKAMTATMIGGLVDEGLLNWSDTIEKHLPDLAEQIDESFRDVTLQELLNHRAGISRDGAYFLNKGIGTTDNRLAIIKRSLAEPHSKGKRGEFQYSNLGYVVAGTIAAKVTGTSWESLIRERVFEPLGMESAGFGPPSKDKKTDQPWGHVKNPKGMVANQIDNPASLGPAGTVHCNIGDWAKFVALHLDIECKNHDLLQAETLRQLHDRPLGPGIPYTGGWIVRDQDTDGKYELWHNGSNVFWYSVVTAEPESGFAVLVSCNIGPIQADPAINEVIDGVTEMFGGGEDKD